jgi:UDP-N-acetyl-D-mannosaminuronic acid dehydrogenase
VNSAPDESKLIHTARLVNDGKPSFVLEKINQAVQVIGREKSELAIVCLGLSFKPNIDDLRESPALDIAQRVSLMGFSKLLLVEHNITKMPDGFDKDKTELLALEKAVEVADIVVLLVDHSPFKEMDLGLLSGKQVVDTRGTWTSF